MNDTGRNKAPASDSRSRRASDAESGHVAELYRALNEQINEARVALEPWATSHDLTTRILAIPLENGGYRVVLMFESDDTLLLIEVADGVVDGGVQPVFLVWTSLAASKPLAVHKYGWAAVISAFTWLFGYKVRTELEPILAGLESNRESGAALTVQLTDRLESGGFSFSLARDNLPPGEVAVCLCLSRSVFGTARVKRLSDSQGELACSVSISGNPAERLSCDIGAAVFLALMQLFTLSLVDALEANNGARQARSQSNS